MGSACWRHCELLPKAVPEVKQMFQWRTLEDVVGSFQAAIEAGTIAKSTLLAQQHDEDGKSWERNAFPVVPCMQRMVKTIAHDPSIALRLSEQESHLLSVDLSVQKFIIHGALGFQTLRNILAAHVSIALGQKGLWSCILKYEDLMMRKSACVGDMLRELGWLHLVRDPAVLGTPKGDQVFLRDAHGGGGFAKASGSTVGGDAKHLQSINGPQQCMRENAHLPAWRAEIVRDLLAQHEILQGAGYDLGMAAGLLEKETLAAPQLGGA